MEKTLVFFTTFPSKKAAERFADKVLSSKLAACLNLVGPVTSHYRWEGRLCRDKEILVIGKTTQKQFNKLKTRMKMLHPYKVPELIALPISDGLPSYLTWLRKS